MKSLLFLLSVIALSHFSIAQNVFNPADPIVRVNRTQPYGSSQHPDTNRVGIQKWVSTPTNSVSTGTGAWDASSYKSYYINLNGHKVPVRIKFPRTYSTATATTKFPVMIFLHGAGEVACPSNGGLYNNEKQLVIGGSHFMNAVNNNQFDGFLFYPQLNAASGCWDSWHAAASGKYLAMIAMLDSLAKYAKLDIDRVFVDGLSGGGNGAWRFADAYPTRVAKIAPSAAAGNTNNRNAFVHIPIWFASGGKDTNPTPASATYSYNRMLEIGADIRHTLYPDLGHSVWYKHWGEPDFFSYMNDLHKANPLIFFGRSEFCAGQAISARMGITAGFYAYEWQKDGVTIATRTNGVNTIINGTSIISFTGNEITVRSYGTYRVRFKRSASAAWSEYSRKPAVIKAKASTAAAEIVVEGVKSKVLPAVDGSTTVPLALPTGFTAYQWIRVSDNAVVGTARVFNAPVGVYKATYNDQFGCPYTFSPNFTVVNAAGTPKPDPATALVATALSLTSTRLNWTQGNNETNFEIYRGTTSGGPYQLISITPANAITYTDNGLDANTTYYYLVRAVNNTGAAANSNQASPDGGNTAPVIGTISNMYVKTDATSTKDFTVSDNPGDIVTVSIPLKPDYVTLQSLGGINYRIVASPTVNDVGWTDITVLAKDNRGKQSTRLFTILVADKNTRSAFVNFGNANRTAPAPWNNWLGIRAANSVIGSLKDENNVATTWNVTTVTAWSATTDLGHITGNNSGIYPDAVLQSGIADNGAAKTIRVGGLNPARRYNLTFVGSQNEGLIATTDYVNGAQRSNLNASYNTNKSANLNSLVPDASGNIFVTITRTGATAFSYLNAMAIEEYDPSIALLNPSDLHVEPINKTTIDVKWSDKTNNEAATGGYELQRATNAAFSAGLVTVTLNANTTTYRSAGLAPNTRYWYRVRAKNGASVSGFSNAESTITPSAIIYVNFNTTIAGGPIPWNNLNAPSTSTFTKTGLRNQDNVVTPVAMQLTQVFNGEFTAGRRTGANTGVVPDNVLQSDYWLDNSQLSQVRLSGLNNTSRYRIGFFGSSSASGWFKGNYTAMYSVNGRNVYLNSWENTTKVVYIGDLVPSTGILNLNFSTTSAAQYGFNGGFILFEYGDGAGGVVQNSTLDNTLADNVINGDTMYKVSVYPNPFNDIINIDFNNNTAGNRVTAEVYDLTGRLVFRQNYNNLTTGRNILTLTGVQRDNNTSVVLVALKVNGRIVESIKLLRNRK